MAFLAGVFFSLSHIVAIIGIFVSLGNIVLFMQTINKANEFKGGVSHPFVYVIVLFFISSMGLLAGGILFPNNRIVGAIVYVIALVGIRLWIWVANKEETSS